MEHTCKKYGGEKNFLSRHFATAGHFDVDDMHAVLNIRKQNFRKKKVYKVKTQPQFQTEKVQLSRKIGTRKTFYYLNMQNLHIDDMTDFHVL